MGSMRKRDSAVGGLAILAAAACLCWRGLKTVDRRLRRSNETNKRKRR